MGFVEKYGLTGQIFGMGMLKVYVSLDGIDKIVKNGRNYEA